jgi:crotonobetainyl-CoA:carnitine CoA-transferase CaiB-like acyl-CoA transferase
MAWKDPRDGESLMWKFQNRGKRTVVLDLKDATDHERFLHLCDGADVLVENFRPGVFERLGLGPDVLLARNPRLVMTRVTGFGQDGPYSARPGFATLAEAMSGFASLLGEASGPPLLPPIALTDEVTGIVAAFATLAAVHSGRGQVVDVSLLESMFALMGPLIGAYHLLGYEQPRLGSGIPYSVPRGTYRTADGKWVAVSSSSESVAKRVMKLLGVDHDERFATFDARVEHRDELDAVTAAFIAARPLDEVLAAFNAAEAAVAPVLTIAEIARDPHFAARHAIVDVDGVPQQGVIARLSATPGEIRHAGRTLDADGPAIRAELDDGTVW